jgi:hypothetical protein
VKTMRMIWSVLVNTFLFRLLSHDSSERVLIYRKLPTLNQISCESYTIALFKDFSNFIFFATLWIKLNFKFSRRMNSWNWHENKMMLSHCWWYLADHRKMMTRRRAGSEKKKFPFSQISIDWRDQIFKCFLKI